jgi:hypothetical protein
MTKQQHYDESIKKGIREMLKQELLGECMVFIPFQILQFTWLG